MENNDYFDLPESTNAEIVNKIRTISQKIQENDTDPAGRLRGIQRLCDKLEKKLKAEKK